jgi:hypothetical protein
MKRARVVCESLFGDARMIVPAAADGLSGQLSAEAVGVGGARRWPARTWGCW